MDEQRVQAYFSLIQELLDCPSEANELLNAFDRFGLLDEGFVYVCELAVKQLQERGEEPPAVFLQTVAKDVNAFLVRRGNRGNQQAALEQFWRQLLQAEMEGDTAAVHQVMRQNMGLIVPALGDVIAQFVQRVLAQSPDQVEVIVGLVENTCTSIQQFPHGRYSEALEIATRGYGVLRQLWADNPGKRAQTLNNLGNARLTKARLGINPAANLESAIAAYDEANAIRRELGLDKDLSSTLNNLGIARSTQAEMGINLTANLESAIAAYNKVAEIRQQPGLEKDLSQTLTNLGNARLTQANIGIDPAVNLEKAIAAYNKAAEIRQQPGLEKDLSQTLTNLGNARLTQANMGIDPAVNLEKAIAAYDEAAKISQQLGLARDLARTLNNFGFAYQAQSRLAGNSSTQTQQALENAYQSFQEALDRVEYLRGEIGADSEGYKRNFNEEWNKVYRGMVEVCLELGRYQDAIEYADRSKARNLTELIATRDAYPGGEIPAKDRQRLQELRQKISEEDRRLKQDPNPDYTHINQLREEFQTKYPYKPLKFSDIQSLLDDKTVILEWYLLNDKFLTFTLTNQTLNLWTSSEKDRQNLIDWTDIYINDYRRNNSQWRDSLPQRLETLAQILHLDEILHNLRQQFPNCQKLSSSLTASCTCSPSMPYLFIFPHPPTPFSQMGRRGLISPLLPSPNLGEGLGVRASYKTCSPKAWVMPPTAKSCNKPKTDNAPTLSASSPSKTPPKTSNSRIWKSKPSNPCLTPTKSSNMTKPKKRPLMPKP